MTACAQSNSARAPVCVTWRAARSPPQLPGGTWSGPGPRTPAQAVSETAQAKAASLTCPLSRRDAGEGLAGRGLTAGGRAVPASRRGLVWRLAHDGLDDDDGGRRPTEGRVTTPSWKPPTIPPSTNSGPDDTPSEAASTWAACASTRRASASAARARASASRARAAASARARSSAAASARSRGSPSRSAGATQRPSNSTSPCARSASSARPSLAQAHVAERLVGPAVIGLDREHVVPSLASLRRQPVAARPQAQLDPARGVFAPQPSRARAELRERRARPRRARPGRRAA